MTYSHSVGGTTWRFDDVELSYLWRHLSGMDAQTGEAANLFPAFRSIEVTAASNAEDRNRPAM